MPETDQLSPGYGRRIVTDDGIVCHVCGQTFRQLGTHVIRMHGFASADDYRQAFGLSSAGLQCRDTRRKAANHAREMNLPGLGEPNWFRTQGPGAAMSPEGRQRATANLVLGEKGSPVGLSPEGRAKATSHLIPGAGLEAAHRAKRERTHCRHGHEFTPDNTKLMPRTDGKDGTYRRCRACHNEQKRRSERKRYAARRRTP